MALGSVHSRRAGQAGRQLEYGPARFPAVRVPALQRLRGPGSGWRLDLRRLAPARCAGVPLAPGAAAYFSRFTTADVNIRLVADPPRSGVTASFEAMASRMA